MRQLSPSRVRPLIVGFVVLAFAFVTVLVWRQWSSLGEMVGDMRRFGWSLEPGWLAAALATATANLVLMASVWVSLFRAGGERIGGLDGIRVWVVTNLGRYIPGKIWQLTGLAVFMRGRGQSGAVALSSALVFQVITLATGVAVAAATIGGRALRLSGAGPAGVVAVIVLLVLLMQPRVLRALTRAVARLLGEEEPRQQLRGRDLLVAAAGMLAAWGVYGVGLWCILRGVGYERDLSMILLTGVFAAGYVIGYVALVSPGGLVVREGAVAGLLSALTPLPLAVAGAVAIVARLWVAASELLAVVIVSVLSGREKPTESAREP
jgi:uncharacterized membrane protein YbhN (UPF0104 family)